MNAVLHRSWHRSVWSQPIRVTVAAERLEMSHPGMLTEWQVGRSSPVNRMLFALARKVGVATGVGIGLDKVESFLVKRQLRPLELSAREGEVKLAVTWPFPQHPLPKQPMEPPSHPAPAQNANSTVTPSSRAVVGRPPDADEGRLMYRPTLGQPPRLSEPVKQEPPPRATHRRATVYTTAKESLARHFPTKPSSVPPVTRPASIQAPAHAAPPITPREPLVHEPDPVPAKRPEPAPAPAAALGRKDLAVIAQLKQHGPMSTQALMQALNWTRWGVRTALESLVTAGIARGSAESANSPHQTYELV